MKISMMIQKTGELLDTTTGDANPGARFSQRNLAKENYYPKGIAFLHKKNLLKDLIYFILVGPKGLKIQFRLKHDLNADHCRRALSGKGPRK